MVECDKELTAVLLRAARRLSKDKRQCVYLDGRIPPEQQGPMGPQGLIATMIAQLRNVVRGSVEARVVVLPHLDLLTSASGGLTAEAREVIPLLYENPEMLWLGFRDPSFPVPRVIENLFPHKESISRRRARPLRYLITQREARSSPRPQSLLALQARVRA
jgi:cell division protease FtsH